MQRVLELQDYADDINLLTPYTRHLNDYSNEGEMAKELTGLGNLLHNECGFQYKPQFDSHNFSDGFNYIRAFLNVRQPEKLPDRVISLIDHALAHRLIQNEVVDSQTLSPSISDNLKNPSKLFLWRGDISLLAVDATVNAANSQMLGCFRPFHSCIDNVIHTYAGPLLRDDCNIIMNKQGFEEPTGNAKITRAYNLPSKFVLHTVGPIYPEAGPERSVELLKSCYTSCLEVASQVDAIRSVAFCCISTGVFMFPQEQAASIAVKIVDDWLSDHPGRFDQIVFNVFTEKDFNLYHKLLLTNNEI